MLTPFLTAGRKNSVADETCQVLNQFGFLAEKKVLRNG